MGYTVSEFNSFFADLFQTKLTRSIWNIESFHPDVVLDDVNPFHIGYTLLEFDSFSANSIFHYVN